MLEVAFGNDTRPSKIPNQIKKTSKPLLAPLPSLLPSSSDRSSSCCALIEAHVHHIHQQGQHLLLEKGLTEGRGGHGGAGSRRQNSINDERIKPVPIEKLFATSHGLT